MSEFLLIAPVLLPLLGAPIAVLIGHGRAAWALALVVSAASAVSSLLLLPTVESGARHYHFGNWPAPFGIEYVLDAFNTPLLLLCSVAATLAILAALPRTLGPHLAARQGVFYALFLLCLAGLNGILSTGDAFNVFVFLEISSLTTYGLVASGRAPGSALGAFQYLILGTLGGSFVLLGIGLWFQSTGSLNMADIALRLPQSAYPAVGIAGTVLLLLGFSLKGASFPLHQWLPAVYAAAPWPVTAFLAACATKVALYALARMAIGVGGLDGLGLELLGGIALVGMLWGALAATAQTDVRRLLAWSSVSQLAYILFAFSLGSAAGIAAAMAQFFGHAAIKGGLFLGLGPLQKLEDLRGLRGTDPWRCALITLLVMGLIGVPLTAGFVAKWGLLSASFADGHGMGVGVILLSSLLAVIYGLRLLEPIWLQDGSQAPTEAGSRWTLLPAAGAVLIMFWLGTHDWAAEWGLRAAVSLGLGVNQGLNP
ncbi:MAG: proton-conducting transporter membrane subunit [Oceanococcaceae bacterium]